MKRKIISVVIICAVVFAVLLVLSPHKSISKTFDIDESEIAEVSAVHLIMPHGEKIDISGKEDIYISALKETFIKKAPKLKSDDKMNKIGADSYVVTFKMKNRDVLKIYTGDDRYNTMMIEFNQEIIGDYKSFGNSVFEESTFKN